ncbi:MAG: general secretion pathway protein GspB [Thermodesulfovibrionales bacterium]
MSYILEALKKLEEKRRRETAPYFISEGYSGRQGRRGHFPWGYLIAFALFLNAGIVLWWLHPWSIEKDVETGVRNVTRKAPVQRPRDMGKESMAGMPGPRVRQLQPLMKTETGFSAGYGAGHGDGAAVVLSQAPRPSTDKTGGDKRVINMSELPLSVRQKLPDLTISGHFYDSRPPSRIVTVGGRILHEGDAAAPGVILERIAPDGVVFSCEGYRFHKGVF